MKLPLSCYTRNTITKFSDKTSHLYLVKSEFVYSSCIMILDIKKRRYHLFYIMKKYFFTTLKACELKKPSNHPFFSRAVFKNVAYVVFIIFECRIVIYGLDIIIKDFRILYSYGSFSSRLHVYILTKIRYCFFLSSYPLSRFYKKNKGTSQTNVNRFFSSPTKKR